MAEFQNIVGTTWGSWLVLERAPNDARHRTRWLCRCACGTERVVDGSNLKSGATTNCGCLRVRPIVHGAARRSAKTKTYRQWKAMRSRCRPDARDRNNYACRGIVVCARWDDFSLFLSDMGECSDGLSLDRIDNDRGYEPGNCRWTDIRTQRRNQRRVSWVLLGGRRLTVQDAAEEIGVHPSAIWNDRRRNGGTIQGAVDRVASRRPPAAG